MGCVKPIRDYVRIRDKHRFHHVDIPRVSLGCDVEGAVLPSPDPYDKRTLHGGLAKRIGCELPQIHKPLLREFRSFVRGWINKYLVPLPSDTDTSINYWLAHSSYPAWRSSQIIGKYVKCGGILTSRHFKCKSFIKRESYYSRGRAFKEARTINSRSDAFKALSGPIFAQIEKSVYQLSPFIKHVPVADRARYVRDLIYQPGATYISTDYTSFEAHFTSEFMRSCEIQMYKYMTKLLPCRDRVNLICEAISGKNTLNFNSLKCTVNGVRMSGDMCTSLGNGFSNLMLMKFWAHKNKTCAVGVVEGDDGLFRVNKTPKAKFFAQLGFTIKIETSASLAEAQFCSMCFNEINCRVVCDPIKKVLNTGWTFSECRFSNKSRLQLLRGKALSLLCESPGAPVVHSFAKWLYRATNSVTTVKYSGLSGEKDHYESLLDICEDRITLGLRSKPEQSDRDLVERHYGIPMSAQLVLEDWFDRQNEIRRIPYTLLSGFVPENSVLYANYFVFDVVGQPSLWRR